MINLFIDTCNANLTIALIQNDKILSIYNKTLDTDLSSKIFPAMQDVFIDANVSVDMVDRLLVAYGPGSFTGIRIGLTIAKTYAWALKKEIVCVSSLEAIATTKVDSEYIVPIIDARRGYVYAGIYDKDLNALKMDRYISLEDLKKELKDKDYTFVSYDNFDLLNVVKPKLDLVKLVSKHALDKSLNPHSVNPNYLKLTEAEMNLKNNDRSN